MSFINVHNITKSFGKNRVLSGLNLEIKKGESFVIAGRSGSGKSVLVKILLNLLQADHGSLTVHTKKVHDLQEALSVGMLFQSSALFDSFTVIDNVCFSLTQNKKMSKLDAYEIGLRKLKEVDLDPSIAHLYPQELSGGMQKRVSLARAIAADPEVLFFDEPTTGLDPITSSIINELISKCVKNLGATAITITHDIQSIKRIGDRLGLLHQGRFVWIGDVEGLDHNVDPAVFQFMNGLSLGPLT